MAVWIAWGLFLAAYAMALRLHVAVSVDIGRVFQCVVLFTLGRVRVTYRGELVKSPDADWELRFFREGRRKQKAYTALSVRLRHLAALFSAAQSTLGAQKYLFSKIQMEGFSFQMRLGLGDAAGTALACGLIRILIQTLCAPAGAAPKIRIDPDFQGRRVLIAATGIFGARIGHIILAALMFAREYASGRVFAWKSTPLKTS